MAECNYGDSIMDHDDGDKLWTRRGRRLGFRLLQVTPYAFCIFSVYDPVCFQMLQHNYGYYLEFQIVKIEMVNGKNNCVNLLYNI